MTRKFAIRLSLLSSIIYIALTIIYFTSVISKINHSDSPSAGAGMSLWKKVCKNNPSYVKLKLTREGRKMTRRKKE